MSYTLPNWQDSPSTATPLTASNLLRFNSAINDLDSRVTGRQTVMTVNGTQTGNYTASANEFVLVDTTSGNITVTFPTAPVDKTRVGVKQVTRGGTNTVTLQLGGTDRFNTTTGPTTAVLQVVGQAATYQYNAAAHTWITVSDDVSLTQSTSRAVAMAMVLGS